MEIEMKNSIMYERVVADLQILADALTDEPKQNDKKKKKEREIEMKMKNSAVFECVRSAANLQIPADATM